MLKKQKFLILLLMLAGLIGAVVSVAMVIRAVQWNEWGRVILYCVTTAISVKNTVLAIGKLKSGKSA